MFTNVDATCHPQRKNKAVFLCNNFSWLNKSEFLLFTFLKKKYLRSHTSEREREREILLISMQEKVIKVNQRLTLLSIRDVMAAASGLFSQIKVLIMRRMPTIIVFSLKLEAGS